VAAFCWAVTLSVSAYWAHPAALGAFPPGELAWMAASPLALVAVATGAALLIRRACLPARVLRVQARLGVAACAAMVLFLTGCLCWLVDGGPGPRNLFHAGAVDIGATVAMTAMLALGYRVTRVSAAAND